MADHWIKVEKGTPDKPEILEMSAILSIDDPDTIVGKLIRVWAWFDSNSENGHAPNVTNVLLDRLTGVTGFVDAMVKVGWLQKNDVGFQISNFERHLGKGAKKRASDAERKRKSREKSQQCHTELVTKGVTETGLDKIREDNIYISSFFDIFWSNWTNAKKGIGLGKNYGAKKDAKKKWNSLFGKMSFEDLEKETELIVENILEIYNDILEKDEQNETSKYFNYRNMYPQKFLDKKGWINE